mmetsp:Transcript_37419/g.87825  ORF Transcript_37419/g.87825 Transcript_37419/m.87825 type:complete len:355 (-) Transcript_37419:692-1756(-)
MDSPHPVDLIFQLVLLLDLASVLLDPLGGKVEHLIWVLVSRCHDAQVTFHVCGHFGSVGEIFVTAAIDAVQTAKVAGTFGLALCVGGNPRRAADFFLEGERTCRGIVRIRKRLLRAGNVARSANTAELAAAIRTSVRIWLAVCCSRARGVVFQQILGYDFVVLNLVLAQGFGSQFFRTSNVFSLLAPSLPERQPHLLVLWLQGLALRISAMGWTVLAKRVQVVLHTKIGLLPIPLPVPLLMAIIAFKLFLVLLVRIVAVFAPIGPIFAGPISGRAALHRGNSSEFIQVDEVLLHEILVVVHAGRRPSRHYSRLAQAALDRLAPYQHLPELLWQLVTILQAALCQSLLFREVGFT